MPVEQPDPCEDAGRRHAYLLLSYDIYNCKTMSDGYLSMKTTHTDTKSKNGLGFLSHFYSSSDIETSTICSARRVLVSLARLICCKTIVVTSFQDDVVF